MAATRQEGSLRHPVIGPLLQAGGGIRVDRGTSDEGAFDAAAAAVRGAMSS